jgi:hypothetical protein
MEKHETQETNQTTVKTLRNMRPLWTARQPEKLRLLCAHYTGMGCACKTFAEMLCRV